jgi:hypothetical protein
VGGARFGKHYRFMEDPEMAFLLVTALVYGVAIFLVASLLEWIFKKVTPKYVASLSHVVTTVAVVSVTTAAVVYIMTRPAIVGPYEQWTFENIGGQVFGGVLAAGVKILMGGKVES